ncbi:hypothetical protein B5F19_11720 [Pseudoflavonifractor sp. An184]|nr:hypothetical protein B5F19_11720 [Pseudoflavonifractor sp. An184]
MILTIENLHAEACVDGGIFHETKYRPAAGRSDADRHADPPRAGRRAGWGGRGRPRGGPGGDIRPGGRSRTGDVPAGARPGWDGELGQPGQPYPGGQPERSDSVREHYQSGEPGLRPDV